MKFQVKAVIRPQGLEIKESLPPVRSFRYAWAYIAALAVLFAGILAGRHRKKG